jgi:hypothetical protein
MFLFARRPDGSTAWARRVMQTSSVSLEAVVPLVDGDVLITAEVLGSATLEDGRVFSGTSTSAPKVMARYSIATGELKWAGEFWTGLDIKAHPQGGFVVVDKAKEGKPCHCYGRWWPPGHDECNYWLFNPPPKDQARYLAVGSGILLRYNDKQEEMWWVTFEEAVCGDSGSCCPN